jgi:hypothetical protein
MHSHGAHPPIVCRTLRILLARSRWPHGHAMDSRCARFARSARMTKSLSFLRASARIQRIGRSPTSHAHNRRAAAPPVTVLAWRLRRLASLAHSRWPYGHAMDSRSVASRLRKNDNSSRDGFSLPLRAPRGPGFVGGGCAASPLHKNDKGNPKCLNGIAFILSRRPLNSTL